MNILGFTITRRLSKEDSVKEVSLGGKPYQHNYIPASTVYEAIQSPFTNAIIWPTPPTDVYQRLRYDKCVLDLHKNLLREDGQGYVDIVDVDRILDLLQLGEQNCIYEYRGFCSQSYRKLRATHCVRFIHVPPEIMEEIPSLFNRVFGTDNALPPESPLSLEHDECSTSS